MKITFQPRWEYDVLLFALDQIKYNDAWSDDIYPLGGVHIQPKPIEYKIDVIEVNQLFCNKHEDSLTGLVNVNVFHTDTFRIEELAGCVELIMDEAYIEGFVFELDYYKLFKQAHGRWMGNTRYYYHMSKVDFKQYYSNK